MRTWFAEYRIAWIVESIKIFGTINRVHIMRKFDISEPQASNDLQATLKRYPRLMEYDSSLKAYKLKKPARGKHGA